MDIKSAILRYCLYQPRCHKEVRNKLYELGCRSSDANQYVAELIEQGVLNEEQYAKAIARGKFRIKGWGRNKIIYELKLNQISPYCIKNALKEIDDREYFLTLQKICSQKIAELKHEKNARLRQTKVFRYLLQRGYESNIIQEVLKEMITEKKGSE